LFTIQDVLEICARPSICVNRLTCCCHRGTSLFIYFAFRIRILPIPTCLGKRLLCCCSEFKYCKHTLETGHLPECNYLKDLCTINARYSPAHTTRPSQNHNRDLENPGSPSPFPNIQSPHHIVARPNSSGTQVAGLEEEECALQRGVDLFESTATKCHWVLAAA
jgi:hypothetical protein